MLDQSSTLRLRLRVIIHGEPGTSFMFVWELVSSRLRNQGWNVWHMRSHDASGAVYRVHLERLGKECMASAPTLTEAYAAAARQARDAKDQGDG
jgi:hypothetical protein